MNIAAFLADRRDGKPHSSEALDAFSKAITRGEVPDYQIAAWLMAAYLNPLTDQEATDLTMAMAGSGERLDLTGLPKPWVDKHSTGGVGDKTTLVLLPLLAACGLTVVKMSGRGLGITGGTVDKLESVPGFRVDLSPEEMKDQAGRIGLALTGQTPNLAPADKVLYGLRDVTGTVASLPLIVSSILSKKIAGGAETVVFDVKCGSGSFMPTLSAARELGSALVRVGRQAGLRVEGAITDMDSPLGACAGNALEVWEAAMVLTQDWGSGNPLPTPTQRFAELCVFFGGLALWASGVVHSVEAGEKVALEALLSGRACEKAREWFVAQGATVDPFAARYEPWGDAVGRTLVLDDEGWIAGIDARTVGEVVLSLGGGRRTKTDVIDPRVGVVLHRSAGDRAGGPVATVYAKDVEGAEAGVASLRAGISVSSSAVKVAPTVLHRL